MGNWDRLYRSCLDANGTKIEDEFDASEVVDSLASEIDRLKKQLSLYSVSDSLVADIRNKLSSPKNLVAMLKDSPLLHHPNVKIHEMIRKEMEQTLKSIDYLSNL